MTRRYAFPLEYITNSIELGAHSLPEANLQIIYSYGWMMDGWQYKALRSLQPCLDLVEGVPRAFN